MDLTFNNATRQQAKPPASAEEMLRAMREMLAVLPPAEPEMPLGFGAVGLLPSGGLRIIEDPHMVETVEDWSEVRSPSRAARRRRQGHRQRIRYVSRPKRDVFKIGSALVMHPDMAREIAARLAPTPTLNREEADRG